MTIKMPKKCFISHSYKDTEYVNLLLKMLPHMVKPIIFPPINVTPDQMVSNNLVKAILDCEGLVWLDGGFSRIFLGGI